MDLPDWLDKSHSKIEPNPYISLIKKLSKINEKDFLDFITINLQENFFTIEEKQIVWRLSNDKTMTKNLVLIEALKHNCPYDEIIKFISWKEFESLTAEILHLADWESTLNFRYFGEGRQDKNRNRFEVDVLAWKRPYVLLIDNKRHTKISKSYLADAVSKQQSRTYELFEMLPVIHDLKEVEWVKKWKKAILIPLITTWKDIGLTKVNGSPVVSSRSFFDLLINIHLYIGEQGWFHLKWEKI